MEKTYKGKNFDFYWDELSDIPVNNDDEIEADFLHFGEGTDKFEVWHWFEETFDVTLGDIVC